MRTPSSFSNDRSEAVLLLRYFFLCASVVSNVTFVLALFLLTLNMKSRIMCQVQADPAVVIRLLVPRRFFCRSSSCGFIYCVCVGLISPSSGALRGLYYALWLWHFRMKTNAKTSLSHRIRTSSSISATVQLNTAAIAPNKIILLF